jgi:PPK2 family polyphosphate:nucleotide phosphotransferase
MATHRFDKKDFFAVPNSKINLSKVSSKPKNGNAEKERTKEFMGEDLSYLREQQEKLFAENKQSLVIILQGMDAAGKDGCIDHVFSGINPQGCTVTSFKAPNSEELEHHFLWRPMRFLPPRGKIAIFNRSYYEEVLVVRVHPKFLDAQRVPKLKSIDDLWPQRFEEIRQFEKMLTSHGTKLIKFFLHVSQDEQIKRLYARLEDPTKHWKVNLGDFDERKRWPQYEQAFEEMLAATSTEATPWYIVPADAKWYARAVVADLIAQHLDELDVKYPTVPHDTSEQYQRMAVDLRAQHPHLGSCNDENQKSDSKKKKKNKDG